MDFIEFVKEGQTIRTHSFTKGRKAAMAALIPKQYKEVTTEIWGPSARVD